MSTPRPPDPDPRLFDALRAAHEHPGVRIPFARVLAGARAKREARARVRTRVALVAAVAVIAGAALLLPRATPDRAATVAAIPTPPLKGWRAPTDFLLAGETAIAPTDFLLRTPTLSTGNRHGGPK